VDVPLVSRRATLTAVLALCCLLLAGCTGTPTGGTPTATDTPVDQSGPEATDTPVESTASAGTPTATDESRTTTPETETGERPRPRVELRDGNGSVLGRVTVTVADTVGERYTGLSDTERLTDSEGMLFVYQSPGTHAYVMRDMAFPLDIVFVAADGTVTTVHHAPTEPGVAEENLTRYPGSGQYVLEVNRGYANRTGLTVGDTVAIPARIATSDATPNPDPEG
jgi:uncharacterized membrane protein (UPF0127 family)